MNKHNTNTINDKIVKLKKLSLFSVRIAPKNFAGQVVEWLNALDSKSSIRLWRIVSSNLTLPATIKNDLLMLKGLFFFCRIQPPPITDSLRPLLTASSHYRPIFCHATAHNTINHLLFSPSYHILKSKGEGCVSPP